MPSDRDLQALFESLAVAAGVEILGVRGAALPVEAKADNSPVTEADRRAEAAILAGLQAHCPGFACVAEEEASCGRLPSRLGAAFILVDPLDGTREFIAGRPDFTVNIALVRDGVPSVGVVHAPAKGVLYSARPGSAEAMTVVDGTINDRRRIRARAPRNPATIVASRSHRTPETDGFIARHAGAEVLSVGSSLKFCMLAAGEADLYPCLGRTMEWDTAAGDAILRAAGGTTCLLDGTALTYGKRRQAGETDFANPWFVASA